MRRPAIAAAAFVGIPVLWSLGQPSAYAGYGLYNVSTIVRFDVQTDRKEYSFNLHLEMEGLDTTSPDLSEDIWSDLISSPDITSFSLLMDDTAASLWWNALSLEEQQEFFIGVSTLASSVP